MNRIFCSSGSAFCEPLKVTGHLYGITYKSEIFSGTMDSQTFWNDLSALAKRLNKYIILTY